MTKPVEIARGYLKEDGWCPYIRESKKFLEDHHYICDHPLSKVVYTVIGNEPCNLADSTECPFIWLKLNSSQMTE